MSCDLFVGPAERQNKVKIREHITFSGNCSDCGLLSCDNAEPWNEGTMFLSSIGSHLRDYMVSQSRIPYSENGKNVVQGR